MNPPRPSRDATTAELWAYITALETTLDSERRRHQDDIDDIATMLDDMGVVWGPPR